MARITTTEEAEKRKGDTGEVKPAKWILPFNENSPEESPTTTSSKYKPAKFKRMPKPAGSEP